MDVIFDRCAGIDVNKRNAVVCRLTTESDGRRLVEKRTCATTTDVLQCRSELLMS